MLRALGYNNLERFHMNEGHAALLTVDLLDEHARQAGREEFNQEDIQAVHQLCVFTTHTPVPAGHDHFPMEMVKRALGERRDTMQWREVVCRDDELNMTYLALSLSHYVNGVAKKHGEVSQLMFARYKIDAITNGVDVLTWAAPSFQKLFDRRIPGWREDNLMLRYALGISLAEIWDAHIQAKRALLARVNSETHAQMDEDIFTLGFARRATPYKRADLLFHDLERLKAIAARAGKLQIIYAGKAHPNDKGGKELIRHVFEASEVLRESIKLVYLSDYDWQLGQLLAAGVDVWLNTPQPPMEASGTSGMKAAVNGVPSLSILDGWWIEGCIEGVSGWAIDHAEQGDNTSYDANSLYDKLERVVIPLYYRHRDRFVEVMRYAIALNGSFFNTQRMVTQYVAKAYFA
jgi:starch phosphorylase